MQRSITADARNAIIAGAAGAVGIPTVATFLNAGWSVTAVAKRGRAKLETAFAGEMTSGRLQVVEADLRSQTAAEEVVAASLRQWGRIHALVNLTGLFRSGDVLETDAALWDQVWQVNVGSALWLSRAIWPHMMQRGGGTILHIGARVAERGVADLIAYTAAKSALQRVVEALADAGRPHAIRCNCLLPGIIDTAANRAAMPQADRSTWISPQAIADCLLALCRDDMRVVSGAAIPLSAVPAPGVAGEDGR